MELIKVVVIGMLIFPITCHGVTWMIYKIQRGKWAKLEIMTLKHAASEVDFIL